MRKKNSSNTAGLHQEDGDVAAHGEHDQPDQRHGGDQHYARVGERFRHVRQQQHAAADDEGGEQPEKGAEHAPLASDGGMGHHGAHLLAAEPASGHEGEDGERESDGQDVGVALEHLVDEREKIAA
jgi:hypothetical protein